MGSIQVYDASAHKWVPYVQDVDKWVQHFKDIRAGRVQPDHKGRYIVGSGSRTKRDENKPELTMVTPVAQAVEMAKSELKREVIRGGKRPRQELHGHPQPLKKLRKKNGYKF